MRIIVRLFDLPLPLRNTLLRLSAEAEAKGGCAFRLHPEHIDPDYTSGPVAASTAECAIHPGDSGSELHMEVPWTFRNWDLAMLIGGIRGKAIPARIYSSLGHGPCGDFTCPNLTVGHNWEPSELLRRLRGAKMHEVIYNDDLFNAAKCWASDELGFAKQSEWVHGFICLSQQMREDDGRRLSADEVRAKENCDAAYAAYAAAADACFAFSKAVGFDLDRDAAQSAYPTSVVWSAEAKAQDEWEKACKWVEQTFVSECRSQFLQGKRISEYTYIR